MKKILVIDDQEPMRRNVLMMLEMEGFKPLNADNGRRGLELARKEKPDLILCDITMPETDGYAVLQALREDKKTATIPFIFLTARGVKGKGVTHYGEWSRGKKVFVPNFLFLYKKSGFSSICLRLVSYRDSNPSFRRLIPDHLLEAIRSVIRCAIAGAFSELNAKNFQLIHVFKPLGTNAPTLRIPGLNQTFRPLQ